MDDVGSAAASAIRASLGAGSEGKESVGSGSRAGPLAVDVRNSAIGGEDDPTAAVEAMVADVAVPWRWIPVRECLRSAGAAFGMAMPSPSGRGEFDGGDTGAAPAGPVVMSQLGRSSRFWAELSMKLQSTPADCSEVRRVVVHGA